MSVGIDRYDQSHVLRGQRRSYPDVQSVELDARKAFIDVERYRVRLQNFSLVGRFGASFNTCTRDRLSSSGAHCASESTTIDEMS